MGFSCHLVVPTQRYSCKNGMVQEIIQLDNDNQNGSQEKRQKNYDRCTCELLM